MLYATKKEIELEKERLKDINSYFTSKKISLNKLKSSIKLSYATKKELDKLKDNQTYEDLILELIEENKYLKNQQTNLMQNNSNISLNFITYKRTTKLFEFLNYKIVYSYNEGSYLDENFQFALKIDNITCKGKSQKIEDVYFYTWFEYKDLFAENNINTEEYNIKGQIIGEYILYFMLLIDLLKEKLNLKITLRTSLINKIDYWDYNLNKLNISENIKEKDINDKIDSFRVHLRQNEIDKRKQS